MNTTFDHLPDCTPLLPCKNCKAVQIFKDKFSPEAMLELVPFFNQRFQHLPECSPFVPCANCKTAQRLRGILSARQIDELIAIFIDRRLEEKVADLELSVRTANCLRNESIFTVGELVKKTEADLLRTPHIGRRSLNELREILAGKGLRFGMV